MLNISSITFLCVLDDENKVTFDPDHYIEGVMHFHNCGKMDKLMVFLASNRSLKKTLREQPGISFLDIIGPSYIAYVICLVQNSKMVWLETQANHDNGEQQNRKASVWRVYLEYWRTAVL